MFFFPSHCKFRLLNNRDFKCSAAIDRPNSHSLAVGQNIIFITKDIPVGNNSEKLEVCNVWILYIKYKTISIYLIRFID